MSPLHGWDIPLGLRGIGALFVYAAWLLLAEYRKVFFADPLSLMSLEVLAEIVGPSGPGYLAATFLVVGAVTFASGLMLTVFMLVFHIFAVTGLVSP